MLIPIACGSHQVRLAFVIDLDINMAVHTVFIDLMFVDLKTSCKTFTFRGHQYFLWGFSYACFGLLVTSAMDIKARLDPLLCMLHHLCSVDSSDSPLVQHLLIS